MCISYYFRVILVEALISVCFSINRDGGLYHGVTRGLVGGLTRATT